MSVKNCLKPVLEEKLKIKNLTGYKFGKLTGFGRATSERIHDPNWIPNERTLETICKTFRIQPGEFLYWVPDPEESDLAARVEAAAAAAAAADKASTLVNA